MTPDLIPPLSIAIIYFYDAWIWREFKRVMIHVNRDFYIIFAICFLLQGLLYLCFFLMDIDIMVRGFWVRMSFLNIGFSFGIPLSLQYFHMRGKYGA